MKIENQIIMPKKHKNRPIRYTSTTDGFFMGFSWMHNHQGRVVTTAIIELKDGHIITPKADKCKFTDVEKLKKKGLR